jgi:hypothetical protein
LMEVCNMILDETITMRDGQFYVQNPPDFGAT